MQGDELLQVNLESKMLFFSSHLSEKGRREKKDNIQ